jgi:hypothetical protein
LENTDQIVSYNIAITDAIQQYEKIDRKLDPMRQQKDTASALFSDPFFLAAEAMSHTKIEARFATLIDSVVKEKG